MSCPGTKSVQVALQRLDLCNDCQPQLVGPVCLGTDWTSPEAELGRLFAHAAALHHGFLSWHRDAACTTSARHATTATQQCLYQLHQLHHCTSNLTRLASADYAVRVPLSLLVPFSRLSSSTAFRVMQTHTRSSTSSLPKESLKTLWETAALAVHAQLDQRMTPTYPLGGALLTSQFK